MGSSSFSLPSVRQFTGEYLTFPPDGDHPLRGLDACARAYVECKVKYDGYLERQEAEVRRVAWAENRRFPEGFEFRGLAGLSAEAVEKLERVRPETLGQASRIPGITPPAVSLLDIHLRRHGKETTKRSVRRRAAATRSGAGDRGQA